MWRHGDEMLDADAGRLDIQLSVSSLPTRKRRWRRPLVGKRPCSRRNEEEEVEAAVGRKEAMFQAASSIAYVLFRIFGCRPPLLSGLVGQTIRGRGPRLVSLKGCSKYKPPPKSCLNLGLWNGAWGLVGRGGQCYTLRVLRVD